MKFILTSLFTLAIATSIFLPEPRQVHAASSEGNEPQPYECGIPDWRWTEHRRFLQRLQIQRYYCGSGQNFRISETDAA